MRNEWDDQDHGRDEVTALRNRRRKQVFIAVAGLAVLGVGSALVTAQVVDDGKATTRDAAALVPVTPAESVSPEAPASSAAPASSSASPSPSASAEAKAVAEEIAEARAAAAKDGVPLKKPVRAEGDSAAAAEAKVVNTGSLSKDRATLRIVSARTDLTGQRELSLVAGAGEPVGNASCSQNIRPHAGAKAERQRNLLICWRVSAQKSVYTVAVDLDGDPSEQESVAAIDREWQALG